MKKILTFLFCLIYWVCLFYLINIFIYLFLNTLIFITFIEKFSSDKIIINIYIHFIIK